MEKEQDGLSIEQEAASIERAGTFEALYDAIREHGAIAGSQQEYEPDELIEIIEKIRIGEANLSTVTRSEGVRDAVKRLSLDEQALKRQEQE